MQVPYQGIILKRYNVHGTKLGLLDSTLGRIDGITPQTTFPTGSIVRYDVMKNNNCYLLINAAIEYVPINQARYDILFLHHVMEICFYFIPHNSCVRGVYELLDAMYQMPWHADCHDFKKIFLFKLFDLLGLLPEISYESYAQLNFMRSMDIEHAINHELDAEKKEMLDVWLRRCIAQHHRIQYFNTVHFLMKNRLV